MSHGEKRRVFLIGAMLTIAGLTAACETQAERQARLEREAYIKSLNVEELKKQLNTVNPDPYTPDETGTTNLGRSKRN